MKPLENYSNENYTLHFKPGSLWAVLIWKEPFNSGLTSSLPLLVHYHNEEHKKNNNLDLNYITNHLYVFDENNNTCAECGDRCPKYVHDFFLFYKLMETPCPV